MSSRISVVRSVCVCMCMFSQTARYLSQVLSGRYYSICALGQWFGSGMTTHVT
jgi:hypothetical protein